MRLNICLAAAAATLAASPAFAQAVTDTAPAIARGVVLQQHSLINNGDLDFGIVTTDGATAGTVAVAATTAITQPTGAATSNVPLLLAQIRRAGGTAGNRCPDADAARRQRASGCSRGHDHRQFDGRGRRWPHSAGGRERQFHRICRRQLWPDGNSACRCLQRPVPAYRRVPITHWLKAVEGGSRSVAAGPPSAARPSFS